MTFKFQDGTEMYKIAKQAKKMMSGYGYSTKCSGNTITIRGWGHPKFDFSNFLSVHKLIDLEVPGQYHRFAPVNYTRAFLIGLALANMLEKGSIEIDIGNLSISNKYCCLSVSLNKKTATFSWHVEVIHGFLTESAKKLLEHFMKLAEKNNLKIVLPTSTYEEPISMTDDIKHSLISAVLLLERAKDTFGDSLIKELTDKAKTDLYHEKNLIKLIKKDSEFKNRVLEFLKNKKE